MNRRSILALLGMAATAPVAGPAMGAKTAAAALGVSLATNEPIAQGAPSGPGFWDSPVARRLDAAAIAREAVHSRSRYGHMKSWGAGFRHAVICREIAAEREFSDRLQSDQQFFERVSAILRGEGGP